MAPARSCSTAILCGRLTFAVQADGHAIETVESLSSPDGTLHPLQTAFHEAHALQCGLCAPGILMSLVPDLDELKTLGEDAIRERLSGNLCRCAGCQHIVAALQNVESASEGEAE